MNPHFFFLGKLSREEAASAFLATLLEQHADFRSFFFRTLGTKEPQGPCQVSTEQKDVDIRLAYPSAGVAVLIENKVRPGALQVNQLVRYYQQERATNHESSILSVLVAPREGIGASETKRLIGHKDLRPIDAVYQTSWYELSEFCGCLKQEERHAEFVRGGFDHVSKMINDATQEKYPLIGGREIAHDIAQAALRGLTQQFPNIRFGLWRSKDCFNIYSIGTDITVYIDLVFRVDSKVPYTPLEIPDPQHVTAILRTQFTLSAKGKRKHPLSEEWDRMCRNGEYDVPHIGVHKLAGQWFKAEVPVHGNATLLEHQLAEMGRSVITSLAKFL